MTSLRRVSFFQKKTQTDRQVVSDKMTVACASVDGSVWVGTSEGSLVRYDVAWNVTATLKDAFQKDVFGLCASKQILVGLGRMHDGSCRIAAYHLYRQDPSLGVPLFIGSVRVPAEIGAACIDVANDFSYIAVGCVNGNTLIYSGSNFGKPGIKPRILAPDTPVAVVAVKFADSALGKLFVVTNESITSIALSAEQVEIVNCEPSGCSDVGEAVACDVNGNLLVGRPEAVFGYEFQQGNVFAIPLGTSNGKCGALKTWRHYFVIEQRVEGMSEISICLSLSTGTRFVAFFGTFADPVVAICPGAFDGHSVLIFTQKSNGTVALTVLREMSVSDRISALVDKSLFEWAIDLATKSEKQDPEIVCEIFKKYGDSFFEKNEFDLAVSVFKRAIDAKLPIETSYVVNKFLLQSSSSASVKHAAEFLEHTRKLSDIPHLSLLISCYQSLGSSEKLEALFSQIEPKTLLTLVSQNIDLVESVDVKDLLGAIADSPGNAQGLLEALVDNQSLAKFDEIVAQMDETKLLEIMKASRSVRSSVLLGLEKGTFSKFEKDFLIKSHVDFCRGKKSDPAQVGSLDSLSNEALFVLLEIVLRKKESGCQDLVSEIIKRGLAEEGLFWCKILGAPASTILSLAESLNLPFEALAYPGMSVADVAAAMPFDNEMALNAQAIAKASGNHAPILSNDEVSVSFLLESAVGVPFGSIQGRLISDFQRLQEGIAGKVNNRENDLVEVTRMKNEISLLQRKPIIHQLGRPCMRCKVPLSEFPIVLFRCMHGYHEHCLEGVRKCSVCSKETQHHLEILNLRKISANKHDELFKKLSGAKGDKFDVAMTYLGHGLFL